MTTWFVLKTTRSRNTYNSEGRVANAAISCQRSILVRTGRAYCAVLTSKEQRQRRQRAIFTLESLKQRRERKDVHEGVEEVDVDEGEGIRAVYCATNPQIVSYCSCIWNP